MTKPTAGELIKNARLAANMTQEELGEKIGVSGVTIMRYEKGQRTPKFATLQEIDKKLGSNIVGELIVWDPTREKLSKKEQALLSAFDVLNDEGQDRAVERVEELGEIPKYQRPTKTAGEILDEFNQKRAEKHDAESSSD